MSFLQLGFYTQGAAGLNIANLSNSQFQCFGGASYVPGSGWRGDGVSGYCTTPITPSTDPNMSQNSQGVGLYFMSGEVRTGNYALATTASGAGQIRLSTDSGTKGAIIIGDSTGSQIPLTAVSPGAYAADRTDPNTKYGTKDGMVSTASVASTGATSGPIVIWKNGITAGTGSYGIGTEGEIDAGAGRASADRAIIQAATQMLLQCFGLAPSPIIEPSLPAFYNANDTAPSPLSTAVAPPFIILRNDPCPSANGSPAASANYAYGPITTCYNSSVPLANASTWTSNNPGQEIMVNLWGNRQSCGVNTPCVGSNVLQANIFYPAIQLNGANTRLEFTTTTGPTGSTGIAKANAVTEAGILFEAGAPLATWQAPLLGTICVATPGTCGPSEVIPWSTANLAPATYFPYISDDGRSQVAKNVYIEPPTGMGGYVCNPGKCWAIAVDYEVGDGRPCTGTDSTQSAIDAWADALHALYVSSGGTTPDKLFIYTDPWTGGSIANSGWCSAQMPEILTHLDYINNMILPSSGSMAYSLGVDFLSNGNPSTLNYSQMIVSLSEQNSVTTAQSIHASLLTDHFAGLQFFPNGVSEGGASQCATGLPNLIITEALNGSCP